VSSSVCESLHDVSGGRVGFDEGKGVGLERELVFMCHGQCVLVFVSRLLCVCAIKVLLALFTVDTEI